MKLKNRRLQLLVDWLEPNGVIVDIGTDHAYLPIAAIQQGKASLAYAADINQKPLDLAIKNIDLAHLNGQVIPVLSDGLTYFNDEEIHLDYVILAGLGASTIKKILEQDTKLVKNYLIASNTNPLMVRKLIKKNHWKIIQETFYLDNHQKYWIIKISKIDGTKIKTRLDLYLTTNAEQFKDEDYLNYLKNLYQQNLEILQVSHDRVKNKELKRMNRQILKVV